MSSLGFFFRNWCFHTFFFPSYHFKNTYRAFKNYSFVPLIGEQQSEYIFGNCPTNLQNIFFLECSDIFPAWNLLFGNVQTMHHLFTMFDAYVRLQFLQECDFYSNISFVLFVYMFYTVL